VGCVIVIVWDEQHCIIPKDYRGQVMSVRFREDYLYQTAPTPTIWRDARPQEPAVSDFPSGLSVLYLKARPASFSEAGDGSPGCTTPPGCSLYGDPCQAVRSAGVENFEYQDPEERSVRYVVGVLSGGWGEWCLLFWLVWFIVFFIAAV